MVHKAKLALTCFDMVRDGTGKLVGFSSESTIEQIPFEFNVRCLNEFEVLL